MQTSSAVVDRVQSLADDLGVSLNEAGEGNHLQFWVPSWCHSENNKKSLSIGTHESDGSSSKDGYPLTYCHGGCDYTAIHQALRAHGARSESLRLPRPAQTRFAATHPAQEPPVPKPVPFVPDSAWLRCHDALLNRHRDRLTYLSDQKGLNEETVRDALIGWSAKSQRYSIPVFDAEGRCANVRLYRPNPKAGQPKIVNYSVSGGPSYGRNRLYVPSEHLDPSRRTLLCAGELDAVLGAQHGWQTATVTGGEASQFPDIDLSRMAGQQVVIAYDNDTIGRTGAERVAQQLVSVAATVSIAELGTLDLGEKGDLGDVWRRDDLGGAAVRQVVATAKPWGTKPTDGPQAVDWTDFWNAGSEPIRYLVDPLFSAGEVTRVFAQAKTGKSLLVLECMAALATGRAVLGLEPDPASVVYIDQENTIDDWRDRLSSMGYSADVDLSRLHWYSLQSWPPLDTAEGGAHVLERVAAHSASIVVLDTQSKMLSGPEDKADTSGAFYRHTLLPLKRMGHAVVIIDHAGNDPTKPRGSSGKRDDVDVVWQIASRGRDRLTVKRTHSRKRHQRNHMFLNRRLDPTRHEIATDDERELELVESCIAAILGLDPRPEITASGRSVIASLRKARQDKKGKGWRDSIVQEAWKQLKNSMEEGDALEAH
jgi:hypothetical protein